MQDLTEAYFSIYENHNDLSEATKRTEYLQKKFNKQNKQNPGSAHKYIPGKQNTGAALQAARESERHMRGDFNEERFPLKNKKRAVEIIRNLRKTIEAEIANASQTRSAKKPEQQGDRKRTTNLKDVRIGESHDFYDLVLDYLLDEGYADTEENAISMMSAMSEDWIDSIISEAPFQISGPHPTEYDGVKLDYKPSNVGKPYKNKKRAETKADKLNQDHGANVYRVTKVD